MYVNVGSVMLSEVIVQFFLVFIESYSKECFIFTALLKSLPVKCVDVGST
jgi:hypothetical protein